MSGGPAYFTESRAYGTRAVLDGMPIMVAPSTLEKVPSGGVHILEHADYSRTRQVSFRETTDPEMPDRHYEFRFDFSADLEAPWWHVDELDKTGGSVYFVPWSQETEVFLVGLSLASWVLPRYTAASQLDAGEHPDVTDYVTRAWLVTDGVAVEQDVITTGTPGAGEVKISGRDVTTPTLTAGQVLKVRYAPAYLVAVTQAGPERLTAHNDLARSIVLTEVREPA